MKKLLIIPGAFLLLLFGCKKNISDLNVDPKHPTVVPPYALFTNAERNLSDILASSNVNRNIFRLIVQYWTETTYTDESNYDLNTRSIPDNFWTAVYRDVLKDAQEAKRLIPSSTASAAVQKNQLAMCDILQVQAYYVLINTFGNIPYTQALRDSIYFPHYDDAKTIYYDLLTKLDADIAALDNTADGFGTADLVYGGDIDAWKKYANSLKLRLGIVLSDIDFAKAKAVVEAAAPNAFTSNSDNAVFNYLDAPPNTNPVWVDLVQSGRHDFVPTNTIVDLMNTLNDPRRSVYFTLHSSGKYIGGIPGGSNTYGNYSHPGDELVAPNAPNALIDYSEVEFILAEAAARGMSVGGTAEEHYNKAITASIEAWGGSAGDAATYLLNPSVNYLTASGTWQQKIGIQKWLALYNRGFDAWVDVRRLDYPALVAPPDALSAFPVRFTYPVDEQNVNGSNYQQAASAIGGDAVTTKLFWDIH